MFKYPTSSPGAVDEQRRTAPRTPSISLPKGGGALRGIGEKLGVNPSTGTATLNIPLALSPGRSGFSPDLTLSYDSGAGNGPYGLGWSLSTPSIARRVDKGHPLYDDDLETDVFVLSGAEDLVPVLKPKAGGGWERDVRESPPYAPGMKIQRYRPRTEGLFAIIERWTDLATNDVHWRSVTGENVTSIYGRTDKSRIADPAYPERIFSWLLCERFDDKGNVVHLIYKPEDGGGIEPTACYERPRLDSGQFAARYLKSVRYGNRTPYVRDEDLAARNDWLFEVVLDYGEHDGPTPASAQPNTWPVRADTFSTRHAGFELRTYRLCRRVLMFHRMPEAAPHPLDVAPLGAECLVASTDLAYRETPRASYLTGLTQCGYRRAAGGGYHRETLPPITFEYAEPAVNDVLRFVRDERGDAVAHPVDAHEWRWVDLDGEGIPGALARRTTGWYFRSNLGDGMLGPPRAVAGWPSIDLATAATDLADVTGDGQIDLVAMARPLAGYHERQSSGEWSTFRPFPSQPVLPGPDAAMRFADLTGDGRSDALVLHGDALTWLRSLGEDGFAAAERLTFANERTGPRAVFLDPVQSVHVADMSGDGLADIVVIRNGDVRYWPNLGYGRFGACIAMARAPLFDAPEHFDPRRVHLCDVDGSGTTDLLYVGAGGSTLWMNEAGNGFSGPIMLRSAPPGDSLQDVSAIDLLGHGTTCLVFTTPLAGVPQPLRFIDVMGGRKPHLLTAIRNNLGLETRLTYASSTEYYLAAARRGYPWKTKVPFPVQVVKRIEHEDRVTGTLEITRYAYRDGYYDGVEREFRGFALVEQWDTDDLPWAGAPSAEHDAAHAYRSPAARTRTWFHTGADLDVDRVTTAFGEGSVEAGGYFRDPAVPGTSARAFLLDDSALSGALTAAERREALRTLRGQLLRQEVYGEDGSDDQAVPFFAIERSYDVQLLQPIAGTDHAVFFTRPRETVEVHYERTSGDPRVVHEAILDVDRYGNVRESVSIAYGRKRDTTDPRLTNADRDEQSRSYVLFTVKAFTNVVDTGRDYRLPQPWETRTFEVFNLPRPTLPDDRPRPMAFGAIVDAIADAAAHELPFTDGFGAGAVGPSSYRRPIEHVRHLFYKDDLSGALAVGLLEPRGLPYDTYTLTFTQALLDAVYTRDGQPLQPAPSTLLAEGGYVRGKDLKQLGWFPATDDDAAWWRPSGEQTVFSPIAPLPAPPVPPQPLAQSEAFANAHFFLPQATRDAWGALLRIEYDAYQLLSVKTEDPLGNIVRASIDYRVLHPYLVVDPNGNQTFAAFDARGTLVATAAAGKLNEPVGDSITGVIVDPSNVELAAFFATPSGAGATALLANATTRFVYDPHRYRLSAHLPKPLPIYMATVARERHAADGAGPGTLNVSFSFSDGSSRDIQKKMPAEAGPVGGDPQQAARWVGSGWTIFNNKGLAVRTYEPFFSRTHEFEAGRAPGVSITRCYDALKRTVAAIHPNHSYEKAVIRPWRLEKWDANDTVTQSPMLDPHVAPYAARLNAADVLPTWFERMSASADPDEAATAAAVTCCAATPTVSYLDALGRTFLTVAHNRRAAGAADEYYRTRSVHDGEGMLREVIDARSRTIVRHDYDFAGNRLTHHSMDAGSRWVLVDIVGNTMRGWDSAGVIVRHEYDVLRRRTGLFVTEAGTERLVERTVYGESVANGNVRNALGRVVSVADGAGVIENEAYDFKGNLLRATREFLVDYKTPVDWAQNPARTGEPWTTRSQFDAMNRPTLVTLPRGDVMVLGYNDAGLFESIAVGLHGGAPAPFVAATEYDAKGARTRVDYQNGTITRFEYERDTFRLSRLITERPAADPNARIVQDLRYVYDPLGNPCHVRDRADVQNVVFFRNRRVEPSAAYTYDAMYRLIEAVGREHLGLAGGAAQPPVASDWNDAPRTNLAHPGDGLAVGTYRQTYTYDEVGNLASTKHNGLSPIHSGWTRAYEYAAGSALGGGARSNRLTSTTVGAVVEPYTYDVRGNITRMSHLSGAAGDNLFWDYASRLTSADCGGGGRVWNQYDSKGKRARQVWEKGGNLVDERLYLGPFEIFRQRRGAAAPTVERETLHVADETGRVALVETRTIGVDPAPAQLVRYQHGNHLRSAVLELDDQARVISYEEFYPFGATSYQSFAAPGSAPKRYRFTGEERDEATGFSYHAARHYAPWLGRWTSCDPQGINDGVNVYAYSQNSPVRLVDPSGLGGEDKSEAVLMEVWNYAKKVADRAKLGVNVQGDHPIQVALRKFETNGEYTRALSKIEEELVVLAETGKGKFHTELGKLQHEIGMRKIAGDLYLGLKNSLAAAGSKVSLPKPDPRMILSESELVQETINAYKQAAKLTGATLKEAELSKAIISHMGTLGTTGSKGAELIKKLENAPSVVKMIDAVAKSSRWAKAAEMLGPIAAVAKPVLKKLGPVGIVIGVVATGKEAWAAGSAAKRGDGGGAAVAGLNTVKEGMYLGAMRVPHLLIPAVAISATQYADEKLHFTDTAADDAIKVKEWVAKKTGSETTGFVVGAATSVGLAWTYALHPVGWARMALR